MCMSKARGWPRNRRTPDPWTMQNLLMPQTPGLPRQANAPQWPRGNGEWAQLELTDALG